MQRIKGGNISATNYQNNANLVSISTFLGQGSQ